VLMKSRDYRDVMVLDKVRFHNVTKTQRRRFELEKPLRRAPRTALATD